jgi:hypothetical protein
MLCPVALCNEYSYSCHRYKTKIMKQALTFFLLTGLIYPTLTQNNISEIYQDGILNGQFESKYANGKSKAEGAYRNNLKIGKWTIWDSLGNVIMTRQYKEGLAISVRTFQKGKKGVYDAQQPPMNRNSDGYFPFVSVDPNSVAYSKRLWREIKPTELNAPLFLDSKVIDELIRLIEKEMITGYSAESDEFKVILPPNKFNVFSGKKLVGYKIKEDWFFDKIRNTGDVRVIGICPIVEIEEGVVREAFWVYYPEIRKYLAELKVDDFFYFHQFNSTIIRESMIHGQYIKEYIKPEAVFDEVLRIESALVETEIDFWIYYVMK